MSQRTIAIVGRTNVGKSALFNKLVGRRVSIVDDAYGVTRDRIYQICKWQNESFSLIDTGGLEFKDKSSFQDEIQMQVKIAIEEAEVIIFVIDGQSGITLDDEFVARLLHKTNKPVVVAANKLEGKHLDPTLYAIGFEHIFPISALHGDGLGNLLDFALKLFPKDQVTQVVSKIPKISIIGKPNVGKSSILNALTKTNRAIVSDIAGTTRDSVNDYIEIEGKKFEVVDTAGIVKKSRLRESVEHYALMRAMNSLEESDIALVVIDAQEELSHFHARIIGYAFELRKPIILVMNKWDLIKKSTNTMAEMTKQLRKRFQFIPWAQIIFISALTKLRLPTLAEVIAKTHEVMQRKVKPNDLNQALMEWQMMKPAPSTKGSKPKITFAKQVKAAIPTFVFFVNNPDLLHFSYKRYLENQLREYFDFYGVPVKFVFRSKNK